MELAECDIHLHHQKDQLDPAVAELEKVMIEAGNKTGMRFDICDKLEGWVKEGGLVNVVKKTYEIPVGHWPGDDSSQKEIGDWNWQRIYDGLSSYCLRPKTDSLGLSWEQAELDICHLREAFKRVKRQREAVTQEL